MIDKINELIYTIPDERIALRLQENIDILKEVE